MSDDPMTAILLAAGVATAATVVFTGVMTVSREQCCGRDRQKSSRQRREPARTIVESYVFRSL